MCILFYSKLTNQICILCLITLWTALQSITGSVFEQVSLPAASVESLDKCTVMVREQHMIMYLKFIQQRVKPTHLL